MSELHLEVAGLVQQITRESEVGPQTRLDGDLLMDSVEYAALAELVAGKYGEHVDLEAFLTGLEIDQIIELTVADVAEHIAGQLATQTTEQTAEQATEQITEQATEQNAGQIEGNPG